MMKKENKKTIILISILVIMTSIIVALIINFGKKNTQWEPNKLYSLTELKFLRQVNTNKIFTTLDSSVNSELRGTYAIVTPYNYIEDTYDIVALKKDDSMVKIATTEYSSWANGVDNLFYSDGKIFYEYADDTIWSIDLTEGNGNYNLKEYEFMEGYIHEYSWFYVINNKIYYFNTGALRICDLITEECEAQIIDSQQSFSSFEIDGKEMNLDFNNVYIEDDKYIYILSEDEEDIYKIDINNPIVDNFGILASYTKVDGIGKNARLLSELNKLHIDEIEFKYEYNESPDFFIEYQNKKYNLKDNDYRPITLLPNNYLMVEHYPNAESFFGEIKYINLKTGLIDENYSLEFEEYYNEDSVYFITK